MEFTPIAPIRPIIDSTGTQQAGGAERAGASLFATVFQSAIDNVRETDAKKVDLEYKLARRADPGRLQRLQRRPAADGAAEQGAGCVQ